MKPTLNLTASSLARALNDLMHTLTFEQAIEDAASQVADRVEPTITASGGTQIPVVSKVGETPAIAVASEDAAIIREVTS